MQTLTPVGEMAYPSVFRPAAPMEGNTSGVPKYQLTLVYDEDDPELKKLERKILEVATAKFGAKAKQMLERGQLKSPLRHGDERPDTEWLEGKKFLTARSEDRPDVVDFDLEDIIDQKEIYAGAEGRMDVWLYAFDKAGNKGVGAIMNSVQKTGEGERKGGRRSASEAFGGEDEDEDDRPASRRSAPARRGSSGAAGSRRRGRDEEPEDEPAPRRRRVRDEEPEDEPAPRRRRR